MARFHSNGKLLLTAEYVVLDQAKALAVPTTFGQDLSVETNTSGALFWKSFDELGNLWFDFECPLATLITGHQALENDVAARLRSILRAAKALNPDFLQAEGYSITTQQDFNRHWGLGTSSTLINNIANWAEVNPFDLLAKTFGGSGYDIACAQHNSPIRYQLRDKTTPLIAPVVFDPKFKEQLYFVYLNQKQDSREGMATYATKAQGKIDDTIIQSVNSITERMIHCESLTAFEALIDEHEAIISKLIEHTPIKEQLFSDYSGGSIKSLGAWGGDFILVTSKQDPSPYFNSKGYHTVIPYTVMVKH